MKKIAFYCISWTWLLMAGFAPASARTEISDILTMEKPLWDCSPRDMTEHFAGKRLFQWVDGAHTGLRYAADSSPEKMTFCDLPVCEAILSVKNEKITRFYLSLFNRGDAGELGKSAYKELLKKLNDALDKLSGGKGGRESVEIVGGRRRYFRTWRGLDSEFLLQWSHEGVAGATFKPEFVNLNIAPPAAAAAETLRIDKTLTRKILAERVSINVAGDRYLAIPMVDQGKKGYCVAAVAERILKYYGSSIDQHQLAQLTNTGADGATLKDIEKAARDCAVKLGIKYSKLYCNEDMSNFSSFKKMITIYNMEARKANAELIAIDRHSAPCPGGVLYDLNGIAETMDPAIYKKVRLRDNLNFKKFQKDVISNLGAGIPVLWSVKLGIVKEPALPQKLGMHMRLITGYNEKEKCIIYSDSWGAGHEHKKMSWEDAWTITTFTGLFAPRLEK